MFNIANKTCTGVNKVTITKEKVLLVEEQETLLIPLYSKAICSRRSDPAFVDEKAKEIIDQVEYDFTKLKVPEKTVVTLCIRAKKMDEYAKEFLSRHPDSLVIHPGCGLDSRFNRVDNGKVEWYDLDMPKVIKLRRKFYEETDRYHMIPSSVTDLDWIDSISSCGRPVMVIAEGLMMYLKEDVRSLVLKLKKSFQGCELAFDAYSTMTAKSANRHPSIRKTGAAINWGIDDAHELERWADGIRLEEEWYFTRSGDLEKFGKKYKVLFKIADMITAAKKAHRILYYCL